MANLRTVYQLSAQFPGPVAPREFITCLLTTETGLSDSAATSETSKGSKSTPRHYMVVSIPVDHPHTPIRNGLVRGHYESVEMIREIPITQSISASTPNLLSQGSKEERVGRDRGSTIGFAESRGLEAKGEQLDRMSAKSEEIPEKTPSDDAESNPVEWIMITRSDPGGGIPRFMVERGTPASITADAAKFIDWAAGQDEIPSNPEEGITAQQDDAEDYIAAAPHRSSTDYNVAAGSGHLAGLVPPNQQSDVYEPSTPGETGIIASLTNIAHSGLENYAPNIVQNNMPNFMRRSLSSSCSPSSESQAVVYTRRARAGFCSRHPYP